jgi:hypothetical protein
VTFRRVVCLNVFAAIAALSSSAFADDTATNMTATPSVSAPRRDGVQTMKRATPILGFAAEPQPQPRPVADRPAGEPQKAGQKKENFRIGAIAGVGFPRPFAVEGLVKIRRYVAIGGEYSFLPTMSVGPVDVRFKAIAADLRVFPFAGSFFVGAKAGRQWLSGRTSVSVDQINTTFKEGADANTYFINPRVGFLKTWESGITLGIDAGVQIPINPSYQRESDAAKMGVADAGTDKTLVMVANALGNKMTPSVDLLRVGFLF